MRIEGVGGSDLLTLQGWGKEALNCTPHKQLEGRLRYKQAALHAATVLNSRPNILIGELTAQPVEGLGSRSNLGIPCFSTRCIPHSQTLNILSNAVKVQQVINEYLALFSASQWFPILVWISISGIHSSTHY